MLVWEFRKKEDVVAFFHGKNHLKHLLFYPGPRTEDKGIVVDFLMWG